MNRSTRQIITCAVLTTGALLAVPSAQGSASRMPECTNAQLNASFRGGDAAMSHAYGFLVLTNASRQPCWLQGFGGLSYVGGGDGTQVGAAADRTRTEVHRVIMEPGDRARSAVVATSFGPYDPQICRPRPVDGYRVYLPAETRAQFVEYPTTGCANPSIHLLTHKAFH